MRSLFSMFCVLFANCALAADWEQVGGNAARTCQVLPGQAPAGAKNWTRVWEHEFFHENVQPVVSLGRVLAGTMSGVLHAVHALTGEDLWAFQTAVPIVATAAATDGRVFFGGMDGTVYGLDAQSGKALWKLATSAPVRTAPLLMADKVVLGNDAGVFYCLDQATGRVDWQVDTGEPIYLSAASDGTRVFVGNEGMRLLAYDLATGKLLWRSPKLNGQGLRYYYPVIHKDRVFVRVVPAYGGNGQDVPETMWYNYKRHGSSVSRPRN